MINGQKIYTLPDGRTLYLGDPETAAPALALALGPQLLLDDDLLENPTPRVIYPPTRTRSTPLLTGRAANSVHRVTNFFSAVLASPFRMWYYGLNPATGLAQNALVTSADGVAWGAPQWIPVLGVNEIGNVLDEGVPGPQRYKTVIPNPINAVIPLWPGQLWSSADGVNWVPGPNLTGPYGEEWSLFYRGANYGLLHRWNRVDVSWVDAGGVTHTVGHVNTFVRYIALSYNTPDAAFSTSQVVFGPGPNWPGETQFYYVSNIIRRGQTYVGLMGILRDELVVTGAPAGAYGTGYTTLVWSLDGITWRCVDGLGTHFFDPAADPAAWDHAMAWITALVPVVDEVYLYYGGYQFGHKVYTDRQIGMVKIQRDRWAARHAEAPTVLRTRLLTFSAQALTLNMSGGIRMQITDAAGVPIPGFAYADCQPLSGDGLDLPLVSQGALSQLAGRSVHLEFELTHADLYAFYLK